MKSTEKMQNKVLQLIILFLCAGMSVFAQDTIVFKNGDVLTGQILKQDAERVYFKSIAFGSVSLNTRDIAEIRIDTPQLGEINVPAEAMIEPEPAKPKNEKVAKKDLPSKQKPQQPKSQWSGQTGLALAMRQRTNLDQNGKSAGTYDFETYRLYGNLNWKGIKNDFKWSWNYRYSKTDGKVNDDFFNLTQDFRHNLSAHYYAKGKTLYQQDVKRKVDNEQLQSVEVGVKWLDTQKLKLSTSGGIAYHRYERLNAPEAEAQTKMILDQSLRWNLVNSLTLFQTYRHLGNLENYHMLFTSGLENKLIRDLFLRLEYRLDRDTEITFNKKNFFYDRALLTSLLYKF